MRDARDQGHVVKKILQDDNGAVTDAIKDQYKLDASGP